VKDAEETVLDHLELDLAMNVEEGVQDARERAISRCDQASLVLDPTYMS